MLQASRFTRLYVSWFSAVVLLSWAVVLGPEPAWAQTATDVKCKLCVDRSDIAKRAVSASRLANSAVTTNKLRDGAVTLSKLGSDVRANGLSGVIVVPAAAFRPDKNSRFFIHEFTEGFVTGNGRSCFVAPVQLPDGALVINVQGVLVDPDVFTDVTRFRLWRFDLDALVPGPADILAVVPTVGLSSTNLQRVSDSSIDFALIDAMRFAYWMSFCIRFDSVKVYGARIFYE